MGWQRLLQGERAARARALVDDIAIALTTAQVARPDLSSGLAGLSVFFAYYGESFEDDAAAERAARLLEQAVDMVAHSTYRVALHGGYTGVAWVLQHLLEPEPGEDDPGAAFDHAIDGVLERADDDLHYDLIEGTVGLGVYALERLPRPTARRQLERIVNLLESGAAERDGGLTWHTPARWLPAWQRTIAPNGYDNLGLAHGVPGVISVLARTIAAGVAVERARALLDPTVTWLLAQRLTGSSARFASWLSGNPAEPPSRSAWCYGDPGVASALMTAGIAVGESSWQAEAVALMRGVANRPRHECGVSDAGLCHGAFGLAHLFHRFFQATGDEQFRDAAIDWIDYGHTLRRPGEGMAGFRMHVPDRKGASSWLDDPGLLSGAAGIGLALMAACSDVEPRWDRTLLVDLPATS